MSAEPMSTTRLIDLCRFRFGVAASLLIGVLACGCDPGMGGIDGDVGTDVPDAATDADERPAEVTLLLTNIPSAVECAYVIVAGRTTRSESVKAAPGVDTMVTIRDLFPETTAFSVEATTAPCMDRPPPGSLTSAIGGPVVLALAAGSTVTATLPLTTVGAGSRRFSAWRRCPRRAFPPGPPVCPAPAARPVVAPGSAIRWARPGKMPASARRRNRRPPGPPPGACCRPSRTCAAPTPRSTGTRSSSASRKRPGRPVRRRCPCPARSWSGSSGPSARRSASGIWTGWSFRACLVRFRRATTKG